MKRATLFLAAVTLMFGGVGQARGGFITSLYNTGVDASGNPLPDSTVGDPHYSLVAVPFANDSTQLLVRRSAGGYPIPPYIGDDSLSAWIGPNNPHSLYLEGDSGWYDYQTTFNLNGLNPATASITGGWSSDNGGVQILLDGHDTGNPATSDLQYEIGFAPFTISGGFSPGLNTLDFIVNNSSFGPTALRVEMTGTAATATPEPSTLTLLGIGAVCSLGYGWRRRRQSA